MCISADLEKLLCTPLLNSEPQLLNDLIPKLRHLTHKNVLQIQIRLEQPFHAKGREDLILFSNTAHGFAEVFRCDVNSDATRVERLLEAGCKFAGELFLQLRFLGYCFDQASQLAQANDMLIGHIADVDTTIKR